MFSGIEKEDRVNICHNNIQVRKKANGMIKIFQKKARGKKETLKHQLDGTKTPL